MSDSAIQTGSPSDLTARIEALLFVGDEPITIARLATALSATAEEVHSALDQLGKQCRTRGIRLQRKGNLAQLVSAPEYAADIQRFLGLESTAKLSHAALETLAVIAYRQPITRAQIEAVRGVGCDAVLRNLLSKGLVEEVGRLESAGRPIQYGTALAFMQHFGLESLDQLPPLSESEEIVLADTVESALVVA